MFCEETVILQPDELGMILEDQHIGAGSEKSAMSSGVHHQEKENHGILAAPKQVVSSHIEPNSPVESTSVPAI